MPGYGGEIGGESFGGGGEVEISKIGFGAGRAGRSGDRDIWII